MLQRRPGLGPVWTGRRGGGLAGASGAFAGLVGNTLKLFALTGEKKKTIKAKRLVAFMGILTH